MKVHVISETEFFIKGNGVHTAFVDSVELLKEKKDLNVFINEQGRGDVLHSHTYGPYYFWRGRKYKGRRVHTVHVIPDSIKGSLPLWEFFMPFVKWYFKKVYSYADVCIAISPMVEKAIRDLKANTNIVRIPNPIFPDKWKRTDEKRRKGREMLGYSESDFVVLGVGQLESRKGVEDFFDVSEAVPEAQFIWAGGRPFGVFTEGIARINTKMACVGKNVKAPGMFDLDTMPYIYAAADLLLFPSYQENCPLVPIEAAASGIPVVFRNIKEYELLYETPYLKASSTLEFIEFTRRFMNDKKFYKEGVKISEQLLHQFNKDRIREELIKLYNSLILS